MSQRLGTTLATLVLVWLAGSIQAGDAIFIQPSGEASQVVLTPLDSQGNFFGNAPGAPLNGGPVALPGVPRPFANNLRLDVGLDYVFPQFTNRAVRLQFPAGTAANFPVLADNGNLQHDFAFIPHLGLDYQFADLGFGVAASGKLMTLTGSLHRTFGSAAGSGDLTAQSSVDVVNVNLVEFSKLIPLEQCACFQDSCLGDCTVLATAGLRYSHIRQDYTAILQNGPNQSNVIAHQDYNGFGVTTSATIWWPFCPNCFLYGMARGSIQVGNNNRNSSFSVTGAPAGNATETKTQLIPVGEFETGIAWRTSILSSRAAVTGQPPPLLWIKTGVVSEIWGNLGLLSAADSSQAFSEGSLILYGFSVWFGLDY